MSLSKKTVIAAGIVSTLAAIATPAAAHGGASITFGVGAPYGEPYYGPSCPTAGYDPYCDYNYYNGPAYIGGRWIDRGSYRHRYFGGSHQFFYNGGWHNGGWNRGGSGRWSGRGGWHH
jgi:hypothetical protein